MSSKLKISAGSLSEKLLSFPTKVWRIKLHQAFVHSYNVYIQNILQDICTKILILKSYLSQFFNTKPNQLIGLELSKLQSSRLSWKTKLNIFRDANRSLSLEL